VNETTARQSLQQKTKILKMKHVFHYEKQDGEGFKLPWMFEEIHEK
jgi:hypothetical protein